MMKHNKKWINNIWHKDLNITSDSEVCIIES